MNARNVFALAALAAVAPRDAYAWDSDCGGCTAGPPASRQPWGGPAPGQMDSKGHNDEHAELLQLAMQEAGLPDALLLPVVAEVFTATDGSIVGSPLIEATSMTPHRRAISEFALLPDQGFALWDWALGFEQCPVAATWMGGRCHEFVGYGGLLNANHFLPQAGWNYSHYHRLALEVAAHCRDMADTLDGDPDGMPFVLQCEQQALIVEAVGQHFLQDAWSAGHMWQRWGGPDLGDLPSIYDGAVVAAVAGLVHGSRSITGSADQLSAPDPRHNVHYRLGNADGPIFEMVGDLYLPSLLTVSEYTFQKDSLFGCSTSGILEVYRAAGANHSGGESEAPTVDPTSESCFGQRATNRSMYRGWGDIEAGQIAMLIIETLEVITPGPDLPNVIDPRLQLELAMIGLELEAAAHDRPMGTDMAEGEIGPLSGVAVNSTFFRSPPASYSDDAFRYWDASPRGAAERLTAMTRIFHRANAVAWCDALESGDLEALRDRSVAEEGGVALQVCTEFAQRHIEYKKDEDEDAEGAEPDDDLLPTPRICDESDEQPEEEQPEEEQPEEEQPEEEEDDPKSLCRRLAHGSAPVIELERLEDGPAENAYDMALRWCSTDPDEEEEEEEEDEGVPPDIGYPQDECEPPGDDGGGDPAEPNPGDDWGSGFGDPHMRTFDGLAYDMHARGEFVLVRTPNGLFEAQIRTRRADDTPFQCDNVGIIDGMALRLGANRFTVQHEGGSFVARLDGNVIGPGTRTLADGSVLTVKARRWYVTRPDGAVVFANTTQNWMHVYVSPAAADRGLLRGLLGDGNGEIGDDLRNASGTLVGSMVNGNFEHTSNELYVGFIQTWFVAGAASLFDHGSGEPATYAKLGDKPGLACDYDGMIAARNQCRAHGVPTAWELACALDVKLAGADMLGAFDDVGPASQTKNRSTCVPTPYGDDCAAIPCGPPPYPACPAPSPVPTVAPTP